MANPIMQDLHIFRGTYKECMARETHDMWFYLAWDTQEIFVGNRWGVKVKYGGAHSVKVEMQNELEKFKLEYKDILTNYSETLQDKIEKGLEEYKAEKIAELDAEFERLVELYKGQLDVIKSEVENIRDELEAERNKITERLDNDYYDKTATDEKFTVINTSVEDLNTKISSINETLTVPEGASGSNYIFTIKNGKLVLSSEKKSQPYKVQYIDSKESTLGSSRKDFVLYGITSSDIPGFFNTSYKREFAEDYTGIRTVYIELTVPVEDITINGASSTYFEVSGTTDYPYIYAVYWISPSNDINFSINFDSSENKYYIDMK